VVKSDVLKLLKTLNTALGDDALSDAHIDEVFEVWWPKLDSQLKELPAEDSEIRPPRTDRDVLGEILGFVRNQSRSAVAVLTDDDLRHIFAARAWKVVRGIHGPVGGSAGGPIVQGNNLVFNLTPQKGGKTLNRYDFVVPVDASPDEMEALILAQVREADKSSDPPADAVIDGATQPRS
jgi:hypothetical protein